MGFGGGHGGYGGAMGGGNDRQLYVSNVGHLSRRVLVQDPLTFFLAALHCRMAGPEGLV